MLYVRDALAGLLVGLVGVSAVAGLYWLWGDTYPWALGVVVAGSVAAGSVYAGILRRRRTGRV